MSLPPVSRMCSLAASEIRLARLNELGPIEAVMTAAIRELQKAFLDPAQIRLS